MKLFKKNYTYENLTYNEITNTWAKLQMNIELKEYRLNEKLFTIEGDKTIEQPSDFSVELPELQTGVFKKVSDFRMTFLNKPQTLQECCSVGKKLYEIYEEKLKEFHNQPLIDDTPSFITPDSLQTKTKTNAFLKKFLPNSKLFDSVDKNAVIEIVMNYCKNNGFPLISGEEYIDDNYERTYWYFEIYPFISLTILIYILFELQYAIRQIFDRIPNTKKDKITLDDITDLASINDSKPAFKALQRFSWLLDIDDDIHSVNLKYLIYHLCEIFNYIEHSTVYLEYENNLYFSSSVKKFFVIETYSSVMAIAWSCLKQDMLSFYYTEEPFHFHKCEICGQLFETNNSDEKYCSDECKNLSSRKNSQKNYYRLISKLEELTNTFNNLTKQQQSKLSKDDFETIKYFAQMKPSDIKKYKDNKKIKTLQKYIDIMNNNK